MTAFNIVRFRVKPGRDQEFRNELSRAMQVFIQVARLEISN